MGKVIKQSMVNMITTYIGFGIGALNTLVLYPNFLSKEYNGLIALLLAVANMIWPLMAFGMHNTMIKFYSAYSDKTDQNKFISMMLLFPISIALILGTIGYFGYEIILQYFDSGEKSDQELLRQYGGLIYVIAFAMTYFELFFSMAKVHMKSTFGNLMKEVFHRLIIAILLMLLYFKNIDVHSFVYAVVSIYVLRTVVLMGYVFSFNSMKLKIGLPNNYVEVLKYSSLILIAGSVAVMLIDLDKAMIKKYLPIGEIMVYNIGIFIASVIAVPSRAMHQITYPITAKLMNEKKHDELYKLYKSSSLNLFIVSGFIFILIVCNVEELYRLIPKGYELYMGVILLIASAKLYDNLIGNANAILYNSKYYNVILFMGVGLVILAYVLNLLCIPQFGILGAALATFIAICCYNTMKVLFIGMKFRMLPFTNKTSIVFILITGCTLAFYFWNFTFHPIINITLKSLVIGIVYGSIVYYGNLSREINDLLKRIPILNKIV
ncbi:lipopolysaccharide biosynthesis protein [Aquimarina rhabdastrellae]